MPKYLSLEHGVLVAGNMLITKILK